MIFFIDYVEDGQTLYENRGDDEATDALLQRLIRDDKVTKIGILKVPADVFVSPPTNL